MARLSFFIIAVALESIIFAPASAAGGGPLVDRSIEQKPAKHGSKPPEALAGQLIQCRFAKASRSRPGRRSDDGHQRAWTYPIGAKWTWKTFYRTATNVEANREDVFNCYVNAFERWTCGLGERVKEGAKSRVEKR